MSLRKTRAFMVETLILVFLLLLVLSVLTQVTGKSGVLSQKAKRETAATMIAQNAAAEFQLGRGDIGKAEEDFVRPDFEAEESASGSPVTSSLEMRYREDGTIGEDGDYRVSIQMGCEERSAGSLLNAQIFVCYREQGEVLASLDTARYIPDYESIVLTVEGDGDITEDMLADAAGRAGAEGAGTALETEADTEEELLLEMETEAGS